MNSPKVLEKVKRDLPIEVAQQIINQTKIQKEKIFHEWETELSNTNKKHKQEIQERDNEIEWLITTSQQCNSELNQLKKKFTFLRNKINKEPLYEGIPYKKKITLLKIKIILYQINSQNKNNKYQEMKYQNDFLQKEYSKLLSKGYH